MLKKLTVAGMQKRLTSKKTLVVTLVLVDDTPIKDFDGLCAYRYNLFDPDFKIEVGDVVIAHFGRFGDLDDIQNDLMFEE